MGRIFAFDPSQTALYQDSAQPFGTTGPAINLPATSFLMWSWRMAVSMRAAGQDHATLRTWG
jgi:hypothetical protein